MTPARSPVVWTPRPDDRERSHVARLMARHGIPDAACLRARAASDPGWFYPAMIEDLGIRWDQPYSRLLDDRRGLPWTEWFVGGRLNLVRNVLDEAVAAGLGPRLALIGETDDGHATHLTYDQLHGRVSRLASGLAGLGVGEGDRVGFYLPMVVETAVALLACLKIGAVPVPVFAGFGPEALAARMTDAGARILLTADATWRRGREIPLDQTAIRVASELDLEHVVVLRRTGRTPRPERGRLVDWMELEASGAPTHPTASLPADAISLILYTSGTTGRPKGAVHTHSGVQIVTAKEVGYHLDVRPGEVMFWLTDIGWMMGPWEILGVLFHRGTVVMLEGAPDHPGPDRIWRMVADHRVTHLALSPTAVRVLMAHGSGPVRAHDRSSVRILGSTGEPWDELSWRWYFEQAGEGRCPVINISGGTELMGCLLAPLPVESLKPCSLQGPALGMDVDVLDERGDPVREDLGHLVCRRPAPNMTRGFLGDPDRYLETYFSTFGPSVWCHGDWAYVDGDGHWFLTGRADDTLKIAGKRIGPGEVEAVAMGMAEVREAAAVGIPDAVKGTRLVLVVVGAPGVSPSDELGARLAAHVASRLGSTMRPSAVVWVGALPMTRSGKIVRGVIRRVLAGEDPGSLASVANPESVETLVRGVAGG